MCGEIWLIPNFRVKNPTLNNSQGHEYVPSIVKLRVWNCQMSILWLATSMMFFQKNIFDTWTEQKSDSEHELKNESNRITVYSNYSPTPSFQLQTTIHLIIIEDKHLNCMSFSIKSHFNEVFVRFIIGRNLLFWWRG